MANQEYWVNSKRKKEWVISFKTLVDAVDYDYNQSCSISVVPEGLKKWNEDAYIPKKVSIGPRFKGSREDLLHMEEVKLRCMLSLIRRTDPVGAEIISLAQCSEAILELDEEVRASYVTSLKFDQYELAKIMLLDGCFLLELLISKGFDTKLPSRLFPPGPAAEVLKDEDVLSDLMLLENQIPILVLHELFETLFPDLFKLDPEREKQIMENIYFTYREKEVRIKMLRKKLRANEINNFALSVLGYSSLQLPCLEAPHILDIVRESTNRPSQEERHVVVDIIDTTQTRSQQVKLNRCALRLLTAGVTMKAKLSEDKKESTELGGLSWFSLVWNSLRCMLFWLCNIFLVNGKHFDVDHSCEEVELKGLDFYFNFEKETLEIEQLHITKTTKAKWCNLIAWEHHKKYKYAFTPEENICYENFKTVFGGKFTWAALIFNGLICSADDVQLLKDKEIIVDHLKMSNQELMEFFRNIASGVDHKVVDSSSYNQMVDDINNFSKAFFVKRMWRTVLTSFTYRQEWLLTFLNHNYNFVATVLSVLAVVQTVYTILAYYYPK